MATSIKGFLDQGWADHVDHPLRVADHLQDGIALVGDQASDAANLVRLIGHTLLAHLGDVARAEALFVACTPLAALGDEARSALARLQTALVLAGAKFERPAGLAPLEVALAHQSAILALEWQQAYDRAQGLLRDVKESALANDAIRETVGGMLNGLAYHLWSWPERNPARDQLTIDASLAALQVLEAGRDWIETGRAHYRVALAYAQAGRPDEAMVHAEQYMHLCNTHSADSYERFFVHEAIARAHDAAGRRAASAMEQEKMAELLDNISEPDQARYCREILKSLAR